MNCKQANQLPIKEVFESISNTQKGKETESEIWYFSPFNPNQKTPSLKLNLNLNTWYDFTIGKGGKIIDLIKELKNYSIPETLKFLSEIRGSFNSTLFSFPQQQENFFLNKNNNLSNEKKTDPVKKEILKITKIRNLKNPVLLEYIISRKINIDFAKKFLSEIYFFNNKKKKHYFACVWENKSKGWEWNNKYGKGIIGKKDVSILKSQQESSNIAIYEGFFDFLSHYTFLDKKELKNDSIILNSVTQIKKAKKFILENNYSKIYLYLDNDKAGNLATNDLLDLPFEVFDERKLYKNFKDFNDFLKNYI